MERMLVDATSKMAGYFLIIGLLASCVPGGSLLDPVNRQGSVCDRTVDVAIVGAGPAGTYAAYRLRETGQKIELLEYSNRIGGRLHTTHLAQAPDVPVELGAMRFIDGVHSRVQRLVQELNLSAEVFQKGSETSDQTRYYLRGTHLTTKQIDAGDVPYLLSAEERANIGNILRFCLEKLTGFAGDVTTDDVLKLKTKDGKELYKLTIQEALQLVATTEGRAYLQDSISYASYFIDNVTAADLLLSPTSHQQRNSTTLKLKNGMDSLAKAMANAFLQSCDRHAITMNRKLEGINRRESGLYQLELLQTRTQDGFTRVNAEAGRELVCARKVILAIPHLALTLLRWKTLRDPLVNEALHAVIPFATSKVFFTFPKAWWLDNPSLSAHVMKSELPFSQMYDWKFSNVSGSYVLLASYADVARTIHLQNLNSGDDLIPGSAPGANKVTNRLKEELLSHLALAFGIRRQAIPEPTSAISVFWVQYPYDGGLTTWKAGYIYNDVRNIIQHPSLLDDVYIVGSDHAFLDMTVWVEGALSTVDAVLDMYFSHI